MPPTTALRTLADLAAAGLVPQDTAALAPVAERYAIGITPSIAGLIDAADRADPIARQFVPDAAEQETAPDEHPDPIGDDAHSPVEGIVHRYPDRVLLKVVHTCAVYCRFCFRREMVGPGKRPMLPPAALRQALAYIRERPDIWEVILTGGDPLVLSDRRLRAVMAQLSTIDHVKVVRLHTRLPVVDPQRITDALVAALKTSGKTTYVVLHANHVRELTDDARAACSRLIAAGIPMLSQSVLLRGVNDSVEALTDLMRGFVAWGIKPYYLHQCDPAPGTAHFRVPVAEGQDLMRALRGRLSGLCQPVYVLDIPGGHGKSPLGPGYLRDSPAGPQIQDFRGEWHVVPSREKDGG